MIIVLPSGAVYHGFKRRSCQAKDYYENGGITFGAHDAFLE